jgi:two-component system OmpR family response regulator
MVLLRPVAHWQPAVFLTAERSRPDNRGDTLMILDDNRYVGFSLMQSHARSDPERDPAAVVLSSQGADRGQLTADAPATHGGTTSYATTMRILVIEDDADTAAYISKGLRESGHVMDHAKDGKEGLFMAVEQRYDVIVVDRMLPLLDGLTIIQTLRSSGNKTPVLILSALGEIDDRVRGLRAGGDDYLVKPFAFSELLARLEALARRARAEAPETTLRVADLEMDLLARVVKRAGQTIDLQPREFRLLEYLMRHQGQVVTRTMLLENVWDYHFDPQTNVIDVHVSRLRRKIDRDFEQALLHTIRGAGYMLREPA